MAYVHTGISAWRRLLVERIAAVLVQTGAPAAFVDQSFAAFNNDNALVEGLTTGEGTQALTRELSALDGPPAVGGEGLNEVSMRHQTFAQVHLYYSWHGTHPLLEKLNAVPVGHFLYGDLCRTMGYSNLKGDTPESMCRLRVHAALGALPTLTVRSAEEIEQPSPGAQREIDRATS